MKTLLRRNNFTILIIYYIYITLSLLLLWNHVVYGCLKSVGWQFVILGQFVGTRQIQDSYREPWKLVNVLHLCNTAG